MSFASIGTAVGSMWGPVGGAIGGAIGGGIDYAISDPVEKGKREDRSVTSKYGDGYPLIVGEMRVGGTITWAPELVQTSQTSAEKAGQKVKTYTYYMNVQLMLSYGKSMALMGLFNNYVKKYTNSSESNTKSILASLDFAQTLRYYNGSNNIPDSLIESYEGKGNVSAKHGKSFIVIERFAVENNTSYNFEAIVSTSTQEVYKIETLYKDADVQSSLSTYFNVKDHNNFSLIKVINGSTINRLSTRNLRSTGEVDGVPVAQELLDENGHCVYRNAGLHIRSWYVYKSDRSDEYCLFRDSANKQYVIPFGSSNTNCMMGFGRNDTFNAEDNPMFVHKNNKAVMYRQNTSAQKFYLNKLEVAAQVFDIDVSNNYVYATFANKIVRYTHDMKNETTIATRNSNYSIRNIKVINDNLIYFTQIKNSSTAHVYLISNGEVVFVRSIVDSTASFSATNQIETYDGKYITLIRNSLYISENNIKFIAYTNKSKKIPLDEVIKTLAESQDNISPSEYDASDLSDVEVHGHLFNMTDTLEKKISELQQIYFFDVKKTHNKVVYVKRGKDSVVTILEDDLDASINGERGELFKITNKEVSELLREVIVNFYDYTADFRRNSASAKLRKTITQNSVTLDLNAALSPDEARTIAGKYLSIAWISSETYEFKLSEKYSFLEETDVINVIYRGVNYTMRIVEIEYQQGIYSIRAEQELPAIYKQKAVGAPIISRDDDVKYFANSKIIFLDSPLLRDQDDKKGVYYAVGAKTDDAWDGALLMTSIDDGISYNEFKAINKKQNALLGHTTTKLHSQIEKNSFDFCSYVIVKTNGAKKLTSLTDRDFKESEKNLAWIEGEYVQFKNVQEVPDSKNTYRLSGFKRGLKGTDNFKDKHKEFDNFVLIEKETLQMLPYSASEFDKTRKFKAISFGMSDIDKVEVVNFTYLANAYECYSPVAIGGGFNNSGAILKWKRRGRLNNEWLNKTDIPLSEAFEKYEVEILKDGNVVRTLNATTQTINYPNAQIIEDFGSIPAQINFNVYQMSELRGRGNRGNGYIKK